MPRILIRNSEPMAVTPEVAQKVFKQKNDPNYDGKIDVNGFFFTKQQIKDVDMRDGLVNRNYNLNIPEERQIIKDFEKDFLATDFKNYIYGFERWLESMDIITIDWIDEEKKESIFKVHIKDLDSYTDYSKKNSALGLLNWMREKARVSNMTPEELADYDKGRKKLFDEMKSTLRKKTVRYEENKVTPVVPKKLRLLFL